MKFIKGNLKLIIGFLIGLILASGVSVYAAYSYFAKDISYTKSDGTIISVEKAINDLYAGGNTANVIAGTNNKRFKLIDEFTTNTSQGYVPVLTSNDSSSLGTAFCSFTPYISNTGAWSVFDGSGSGSLVKSEENTAYGYVGFKTSGILMYIKRVTATVSPSQKNYNYALQYLDLETGNWIDIETGTLNANQSYDLEGTLETPVYTTAFRLYSDTYKTSGNNLRVDSLQAYPPTIN